MNENFSQTPSVDVNEGSFFSFKGICSVKKYWLHFLISLAVVLLDYGYYFFIKNPPHWLDVVETVVSIVFLIVWNIHLICLGVQRFRAPFMQRSIKKQVLELYNSRREIASCPFNYYFHYSKFSLH